MSTKGKYVVKNGQNLVNVVFECPLRYVKKGSPPLACMFDPNEVQINDIDHDLTMFPQFFLNQVVRTVFTICHILKKHYYFLQIQQAATVLFSPETEMAQQPEVQTRPPEVAMAPMGS